MTGFPANPSAMTSAWLESALEAPAGSLSGFEAAPVGTGQVAASYRLRLDWKEKGGPASIVAKCPSVDATSRQTGTDWGLYAREVQWYSDLARQSPIRCPRCYHAGIDQQGEEFILLLEDCAPAGPGDQFSGAAAPALKQILSEAARLHASFLGHPVLEDAEFLKIEETNRPKYEALYAMVWPLFRERYKERLDPALLELGDDFDRLYSNYLNYEAQVRTLCHGDFRVDNMLFGEQGDRVVILDWQTLGTGSPMVDVAYLISTSMSDLEERRQHETELVEYYFSLLETHDAKLDRDSLWKDYRVRSLSGFLTAVISAIIVERTERGDELFAVMAERSGWQAMDHDSLSLL